MLDLLVIAATEEDLDGFDLTHAVGCWLGHVVNRNGASLSRLANHHIVDSFNDVVGLCHADARFGPGALQAFYDAAMRGAVSGIVGRDLQDVYRWSGFHESDKSPDPAPGNPGPVSTLDGCAVFFRRDLGLRFDETTFDGFHCHVEDLCLQAQRRGIPVIVPAAEASHPLHPLHGDGTAEWVRQYVMYRNRLDVKWRGTKFCTT